MIVNQFYLNVLIMLLLFQVDFIVLRLLSENDFDKEIKAHIKSKFGTLTGYTWETNWDSNS